MQFSYLDKILSTCIGYVLGFFKSINHFKVKILWYQNLLKVLNI